jgi:UDP-3-O-[3-hydroxymyristoyl] glucosamine N-acyltransferase
MSYTVSEIASKIQGEVIGDGSILLKGFSTADKAGPGDLTFAENEEFFAKAEESAASAVLVPGDVTSTRKVLIRVADIFPRTCFCSWHSPDGDCCRLGGDRSQRSHWTAIYCG